jgi:multiple sugar transport system substrate-binding protein
VANLYVEGEGQLSLPFAVFPSFIYYRPELFDRAGLAHPPSEYGERYIAADGRVLPWDTTTVRELAMLLSLDAGGNNATSSAFNPAQQVQWGFVDQWNEPRGASSMFGANSILNARGDVELAESWYEGFRWLYRGIWDDHFIPNAVQESSDVLSGGNLFASGNVAMARGHLWYTCCIGDAGAWEISPMFAHNGVVTAKLHQDGFYIPEQSSNPEAAFVVMTYLLGDAAPALLEAYGGTSARPGEYGPYLAQLTGLHPFVDNWHLIGESTAYAERPNHETYVPNLTAVVDRIGAFGTLYKGTPGLDIDAELDRLETDLQRIIDQ